MWTILDLHCILKFMTLEAGASAAALMEISRELCAVSGMNGKMRSHNFHILL